MTTKKEASSGHIHSSGPCCPGAEEGAGQAWGDLRTPEPAAPAGGRVIVWVTNDHVRWKPQSLWLQATVITHTVTQLWHTLFKGTSFNSFPTPAQKCPVYTRKMKSVWGGGWKPRACALGQESAFLKRSKSGVCLRRHVGFHRALARGCSPGSGWPFGKGA